MLFSKRSPTLSVNPAAKRSPATVVMAEVLEAIDSFTHSTRGRLAGLGALALIAGCGSATVEETNIVEDIGCSPIPDCPALSYDYWAPSDPSSNFFDVSGRFRRYDPATGEAIKVCEPVKRNFCTEGQTPAEDHCEPPVCENATMCDPIPAHADNKTNYKFPYQANYPTTGELAPYLVEIESNDADFPIIFDNTPDCLPGQDPSGDSYYSCDVIPTCSPEKQIPYCDPLPRCQPGQSPLSCEERDPFTNFEESYCFDFMADVNEFFWRYGLDVAPVVASACDPILDPNQNLVYRPPIMKMTCLPTPECQPGEFPQNVALTIDLDCGKWGSWQSYDSSSLSCDPIKSCQ